MFFTRPQKQNGSVSWRQDINWIHHRLALPASYSGALGTLISSFCMYLQSGFLSAQLIHIPNMTFEPWAIQVPRRDWHHCASQFQVTGQEMPLCQSEMSSPFQRAECWRFWQSDGGSGEAMGVGGDREPSRYTCISTGFAAIVPDRALGSWLGLGWESWV